MLLFLLLIIIQVSFGTGQGWARTEMDLENEMRTLNDVIVPALRGDAAAVGSFSVCPRDSGDYEIQTELGAGGPSSFNGFKLYCGPYGYGVYALYYTYDDNRALDDNQTALLIDKLSGTVPKELIVLEKLTILGLSGQELHGTVPSEAFHLPWMQSLSLANNKLDGSLPSLSTMTRLTELDVSSNQFSEEFPSITNLRNLTTFLVNGNAFRGTLDFSHIYFNLSRCILSNSALTQNRFSCNPSKPPVCSSYHLCPPTDGVSSGGDVGDLKVNNSTSYSSSTTTLAVQVIFEEDSENLGEKSALPLSLSPLVFAASLVLLVAVVCSIFVCGTLVCRRSRTRRRIRQFSVSSPPSIRLRTRSNSTPSVRRTRAASSSASISPPNANNKDYARISQHQQRQSRSSYASLHSFRSNRARQYDEGPSFIRPNLRSYAEAPSFN